MLEGLLRLVHSSAGVWVHGVDLRPDDAVEAACLALLDDTEQARAVRFKVTEPRRQFVITRGALRLLLARHLARPPQALSFAAGVHGKPYVVVDGAPSRMEFNVSHSAGRGLIASRMDRSASTSSFSGARRTFAWWPRACSRRPSR